jgi:hypothetical protein
MKRETRVIMVLIAIIWIAIISHLTHPEPVVKVKDSFKFVKVKDWSKTVTGPKVGYLNHLYNTK